MSVAVKICGVRDAASARLAVDAGADYLGLVFYDKSPRCITIAEAEAIAEAVEGNAKLVCLFVDAVEAELEKIVEAVSPDLLQFHGQETVEQVRQAERFGIAVAKVIPLGVEADLAAANAYEDVADWLIFDAKPSAQSTRPGGNGAAFNWQLLAGKEFALPWMLSGGLNAHNVKTAIHMTGAKVVDVSSGVEDRPGHKNPELIRQFIAAAKGIEL